MSVSCAYGLHQGVHVFHILLLQPFSQKSRTPTIAKEFQIGLYDPAEADLELFCNSWSAGFLGERLYCSWSAARPLLTPAGGP